VYQYYVRELKSVVDGDTIDVVIDLGFNVLFEQRVRLAGIDTPELRTSDKFEKTLGLESKEYLKKQLKEAKSIVIKTEKMNSSEKYGRILGWLYVNGDTESVNDKMISDGYAWGYLGNTKKKVWKMKTVYYFTADWCQPCKRTRPIVEELNREQKNAGFQIIDVDDNEDLVKTFNIGSVPTFILFDNDIEKKRIIGGQTKKQLEEFINYEEVVQKNI
jgi:micrococcal nuclease